MTKSQEKPREKYQFAEELVLLTDEVHLWIVRIESLLLMCAFREFMEGRLWRFYEDVDIEDCPDDNWKKSEDHIVEGYWPAQPKGLTRSETIETVYELDSCEHHVFVEEVKDHLRNADIVQPTVIKQQLPKQAKLTDGIVGHLSSSSAFLPEDANSYVGLHNHVDVIGPVPDC